MFLKKNENFFKSPSIWLLILILATLTSACDKSDKSEEIVARGQLTIAPNGGSSTIVFEGQNKDTITIELIANDMDCEPYGHLEPEGGKAIYLPLNSTAKAGKNRATTTLELSGNYTLSVFDGTNRGCEVSVFIKKKATP